MKFLPRTLALVAVPTAAVLALASPASAATTADPVAAANWLGGALTDGNHLVIGTYAQDGTSADALFSLLAAGGHTDAVAAIDSYLAGDVANYADPDGTGAYPGPYSGSLAKLSLVAEVTRGNPHSYGGFDLLNVLVDKQCTAANTDGTCNAPGEFFQAYSTISQALGVIALQRSPVAADHQTLSSPAVVRLLALQCTDGSFTGTLLAPGATCASGEADTTAYAVQALSAVDGTATQVTAGLDALVAAQDPSGGFTGAAGVNSNGTGLALSAFSLAPGSYAAAITSAQGFLAARQRNDGALAVSATNVTDDGAKLATAQALLGVLGRNLADPALVVAAPVTPTPTPTPTPTTGGTTTAPVGPVTTGATLAATGVADGHLSHELALALGALAGGSLLVWSGSRRVRAARHRA